MNYFLLEPVVCFKVGTRPGHDCNFGAVRAGLANITGVGTSSGALTETSISYRLLFKKSFFKFFYTVPNLYLEHLLL